MIYFKSASTEFLTKTSDASCQSGVAGDVASNTNTSTTSTRFDQVAEPPQIQPYSGVLSKSLFSVIVKPQPVKPILEFTSAKNGGVIKSPIPTSLIAKLEESTGQVTGWSMASMNGTPKPHHNHHHRNSDLTRSSNAGSQSQAVGRAANRLNKKKCISINNLLYDSNNSEENSVYQNTTMTNGSATYNMNPNSARSVTFLGPSKQQLEAAATDAAVSGECEAIVGPPQATVESISDDNSIDIDDLDNYNYENADSCQQMVDVIIGGSGTSAATQFNSLKNSNKEAFTGFNNNEKQRIAELEDVVKKLSTELTDLKDRLKQEAEKVYLTLLTR